MVNYQTTQGKYQLTQEDLLTKFYNSLFLAYELADELHLNRDTLDKINTEVMLTSCDIRELTKKEKLKRVPSSYTTPDGKAIIFDEGYFSKKLKRSPRLKKLDKDKLQILSDVYCQFRMDHEFLHSYLILSGEAKRILEKHGQEKYLKKMEYETDKLQKKVTIYRIEHSEDQNAQKIWNFWLQKI